MTAPDGLPRTPFDQGFAADPHTRLAAFRDRCPVARVTTPAGRPVWIVTRDADVRAGFRDPRLSTRAGFTGTTAPRRALDVTLVGLDPPHHTRIRRLAGPVFTPQRVETYRPVVEAVAARLLDRLERRRAAGALTFDLMADFAHPFSFQVMCELFALAPAVRADLYAWTASVFDRPARDRRAAAANVDRLDAFFRAEVDRRLLAPGDDMMSSVIAGWDPHGDVTRDELVSLCATLLLAGYESTAQMIGMSMAELLARPDPRAVLRGGPETVSRAVSELLRFTTPGPSSTMRTATADVRYGDTVIPAGDRVLLSIAAANRDPGRYENPDLLDLGRPSSGGHLTFGLGPHYCLGAPLARLELTVALTAIAARFPGIAPATPLDRLSWRGNHLNRGLAALPVHPSPTPLTPPLTPPFAPPFATVPKAAP